MSPSYQYPTHDETWNIVSHYLSKKGASDQSIQSFNNFVHRAFPQCIYELFRIESNLGVDLSKKLEVKVTNVVTRKPILLNNDINVAIPQSLQPTACNARLLRSSLVAPVYISLELRLQNKVEHVPNLLLCYLPIMVGSELTTSFHKKKEIVDDGYFIINGNEKVLVAQETKLNREIIIMNGRCMFRGQHNGLMWWLEKTENKLIDIVSKHGRCSVSYIFAFFDYNLAQIFPLLVRVETECIMRDSSPKDCVEEFQKVFPHTDLDFVPLFGSSGRLWLAHLSYMCFLFTKSQESFDRDHLQNKRVQLPCELLLTVAEKSLKRLTKSFQKRMINFIEKNPSKQISRGVARALDSRVCTEAFFYSLSTGNFPSVHGNGVNTGVAQQRSNYNFSSILSQARRIHSGDEKRSIIAQREVRGDEFGYIGPYDTAEGRSCGCNKSFAVCTIVSIEFDPTIIDTCLNELKSVEYEESLYVNKASLIFLNGVVTKQTKSHRDLLLVYEHLLRYRRCGIVDCGVSVLIKKNNLYVRTDGGRILRPLFVVETLHRHFDTSLRKIKDESFEELLGAGIIEFIDSAEEDTKLVAESFDKITKDTELCEIHPTLILSFNTAYGAPFSDCNQGPRVTYQNAMMKQSQSQIPVDFYSNMKSRSHSLLYGQKPLAATKLSQVEGFPLASGLNCIVCIGCYDGYNQEDSVIMSRAFIERGGFRMLDQKTFTYSGSEIISNESARAHWKKHDTKAFQHLDDDALPCPGKTLSADDIILAKHCVQEDGEKLDSSVKAKDKKGTIQRVIFGHGQRRKKSTASDEAMKVNITSYECRAPIVGDKLASRMAQKGTIAHIEDPENLPFNSEGIVPDIIINPSCIPTRMTVGQLLEMLGCKAAAMNGEIEDATAFTHPTVDELSEKLHQAGFQRYGDEQLIDGQTGHRMKAKWFTGICYYQRLKHMVLDKLHSRTESGARSLLSRQPPSGRSNNGGHRVGEMESVAIIAAGASLTHQTLWNQSDPSKWKMCPTCGLYQPLNAQKCFACKEEAKPLQEITCPYSFKLLQQELYQCGIMIKDKSAALNGTKHLLATSS